MSMTKPERVYQSIRAKIASGAYPVGSSIPSTRELIAEHEVGYATLREALRELKRDGLIEGRQGDGVYVLRKPD